MPNDDVKTRQRIYKRAYRERKKRETEILLTAGEHVFDKAVDIIKEMIQSSNSNPLMGSVAAVVLADILARSKIIDPGTAAGIWAIVGAIDGSSIAGSLISDFTDIFKIFSKSPSQDLMRPSATTIVYGNKTGDLQSLMNKE